MNYILKQFDEPLVKFSATTDTSEPEIQILWTNEEKAALLPLDLTLTPELREKLRHLLNFKFKKHSRYNLPEKRLRMMERQVQKRARILLNIE